MQDKAPRRSWRRTWLFRLLAATLVPAFLFLVLELSLRLFGYGFSTDFFLDGSKVENAEVWIDNPDFGHWVFPHGLDRTPEPIPFALPKVKAKNTFRIFVLGESAAMGYPDPSFSFPRVLAVLLKTRYPDRDFEVVNTSMAAINSHVVLPIARQCLRRQPDLLVVHLGNNEVLGPFGAAGVLGPFSPHRYVVRANLALKTTRTGQLLHRTLRRLAKKERAPRVWRGMTLFVNSQLRHDDSRLTRIYSHFRENLQDICQASSDAGVPVVVCTIPVNLVDCAPMGSLHSPDLDDEQLATWDKLYDEGVRLEARRKYAEALGRYRQAAERDDQFADLAFRQARCCAALGQKALAREHYLRARDLDTLRFRSDSTINDTIRDVAADQGVHLADAEEAFSRASTFGLPGEDFFLEYVHMNFRGNYLLARTVLDAIPNLEPAGPKEPLSEEACAARLAYTDWSAFKIGTQVRGVLGEQPPFNGQLDRVERGARWKSRLEALDRGLRSGGSEHAVRTFQKAVEQADGDWMLHLNFGQLLSECGAGERAEEQYLAALKRLKHCVKAHCKLGQLLLGAGKRQQARLHFKEAVRLAPDRSEGYLGLASVLAEQGRNDEALALYHDRLRHDQDRANVLQVLGLFLLRTGKLGEARERFTEALEQDPDNSTLHVYLGDVALEEGNRREAIRCYESALRLRPDWPELRAHLARVRPK